MGQEPSLQSLPLPSSHQGPAAHTGSAHHSSPYLSCCSEAEVLSTQHGMDSSHLAVEGNGPRLAAEAQTSRLWGSVWVQAEGMAVPKPWGGAMERLSAVVLSPRGEGDTMTS